MGILDSLVGQPPLESSPLDMEDKCQCRKPIQFLTPILADIVLKKGQKRTGNASTYKLRASLHTRHDGNIAKSQQAASRNEKRKSQPFSGPITNFATYIDILVITCLHRIDILQSAWGLSETCKALSWYTYLSLLNAHSIFGKIVSPVRYTPAGTCLYVCGCELGETFLCEICEVTCLHDFLSNVTNFSLSSNIRTQAVLGICNTHPIKKSFALFTKVKT